jgi:hypothetical protein
MRGQTKRRFPLNLWIEQKKLALSVLKERAFFMIFLGVELENFK